MSVVTERLLESEESVFIDSTGQKDSPYAEVRASVPNWDNGKTPQNTLRMWVIGVILTTVASCLNILLSLQETAFCVSPSLVIIAAHPFGKLWAKVVPRKRVWGIDLNPGPFNIKEHGLISIMAACTLGTGPTYLSLIMGAKKFFRQEVVGYGFGILLMLSTQLMGLALSGLVRRILIYPQQFIFPSSLVTVTLLTNLHIKSNYLANGWSISRLKLLVILMVGGALYQWVPSFLATFMSRFSWSGWIAPENVVVNQLFGITSGVALLPLCFDWRMISGYLGSPLVPPINTLLNMATMVVLVLWIVIPIVSFTNVWYGDYLPMVSSVAGLTDRFQQTYDISRVLDDKGHFVKQKYQEYSPIFLADSNAIAYGLSFGAISATFVHFALFDLHKVYKYWRSSRDNSQDLHMQLMRKYTEIPTIIYAALYIFCIVLAIIAVHFYTELNIGPLFLALAITTIMFLPNGIMFSTTNIDLELGVVSEFIAGYLQQGNSEANMLFKMFCSFPHLMGIIVLQYMKLAHYLKLSPWLVFAVQFLSLIWGGIVQWVCMMWAGRYFANFCSLEQPDGFTCSTVRVFYNSALTWGTIGAKRVLKVYRPVLYLYVIGAVLPFLSWVWLRRYPRSFFRYLNWPVFLNSAQMIPPATPYNYVTFLQVGFLFTFYIRRHYFNWWSKYNYTVSVGLELAVVIGQLIIVIVELTTNVQKPRWWGNVGFSQNVDDMSVPRTKLSEGEAFGPSTW